MTTILYFFWTGFSGTTPAVTSNVFWRPASEDYQSTYPASVDYTSTHQASVDAASTYGGRNDERVI